MKKTLEIDDSNLLRRLITAVTIFGLVFSLAACRSAGPNGAGGVAPPAASPTVELTIKVKAAGGASADYGLVPGNAAAGAAIDVGSTASSDGPSYGATTDDSGHAVLLVQSGSYRITAKKDTGDPKCWWYGSTEVEVADQPVTVNVDDLWVLCE